MRYGEAQRVYDLPPKLLKAGENIIVVNVHDFWGNGGIYGPASERALLLADGTRVPLAGWEYQVAPKGLGVAAACAVGIARRHERALQRA